MNDTMDSVYSLQQAIEDGALVAVFKNRWARLSAGTPIVATRHVFDTLSLAALREIWSDYVTWMKGVKTTLPAVEQLFATTMDGETVRVIADGAAHTIMYPEDYRDRALRALSAPPIGNPSRGSREARRARSTPSNRATGDPIATAPHE
jgi:hypothetical protein